MQLRGGTPQFLASAIYTVATTASRIEAAATYTQQSAQLGPRIIALQRLDQDDALSESAMISAVAFLKISFSRSRRLT